METAIENTIKLEGKLAGFKSNKHEDIDSLEITNSEDKPLRITFPPHTANEITKVAKKGDQISVTYKEEQPKDDPKGDKKPKLKLQTIEGADGKKVNVADIKPEKPAADQSSENLQLDKFELLKGKKGELNGIKSDKKVVHIHKEDSDLGEKIKENSKLNITATKRTDKGFINQNDDEVYHAHSIEIDGQHYPSKKKDNK